MIIPVNQTRVISCKLQVLSKFTSPKSVEIVLNFKLSLIVECFLLSVSSRFGVWGSQPTDICEFDSPDRNAVNKMVILSKKETMPHNLRYTVPILLMEEILHNSGMYETL